MRKINSLALKPQPTKPQLSGPLLLLSTALFSVLSGCAGLNHQAKSEGDSLRKATALSLVTQEEETQMHEAIERAKELHRRLAALDSMNSYMERRLTRAKDPRLAGSEFSKTQKGQKPQATAKAGSKQSKQPSVIDPLNPNSAIAGQLKGTQVVTSGSSKRTVDFNFAPGSSIPSSQIVKTVLATFKQTSPAHGPQSQAVKDMQVKVDLHRYSAGSPDPLTLKRQDSILVLLRQAGVNDQNVRFNYVVLPKLIKSGVVNVAETATIVKLTADLGAAPVRSSKI